ncbi:MAG TPA: hypothetical protein VE825_09470 [Terriglobales bacterium]|jgi:hypothetical protein|nr:hypothetical protein [Terriglobales bacterium]
MSEGREKFADEVLDKALANYSQAEPRMGLEGRVLARLEEQKTARARTWWRWAWAPAAAALLIAGGLYLARPKTETPPPPSVAEKSAPPVIATAPTTQPPFAQTAAQIKPRVRPSPRPRPALSAAAAKQPQFPAPQALSRQDRLLLAYVRLQPQAAAQQAKAAGEPLAEIQIEPLDIPSLNPDEDQQAPQH